MPSSNPFTVLSQHVRILFAGSSEKRKTLRKRFFRSQREDNGKNNRIIIVEPDGSETLWKGPLEGIYVHFDGDNNTLRIHRPFHFEKVNFCLEGSDILIEIKENHLPAKLGLRELESIFYTGAHLEIGRNFFNTGPMKIYNCDAGHPIKIGDDCMFSGDILLRAADGHPIVDAQGNVLNSDGGVEIGNHVWVGYGAMFLKKSAVAGNSIVGSRALITKRFTEPDLVLGGSPAKIIKRLEGGTWRGK